MTNLDSILITGTLLYQQMSIQSNYGFLVVIYGCECWTIKKIEYQRISGFELWCWKRLLLSPLDCKGIQPVNLKEIIVIGRTVAKAEAPTLWPPDVKN